MDKGISESSFLGAGNPLPSILLHSIVSYCTHDLNNVVVRGASFILILIGIPIHS